MPISHYTYVRLVYTYKYPSVSTTDQRAHPSRRPVGHKDPRHCRSDADVDEGGTAVRFDERLLPPLRVVCNAHGRHRVAILDRIIERCQFGHAIVAMLRRRKRVKWFTHCSGVVLRRSIMQLLQDDLYRAYNL